MKEERKTKNYQRTTISKSLNFSEKASEAAAKESNIDRNRQLLSTIFPDIVFNDDTHNPIHRLVPINYPLSSINETLNSQIYFSIVRTQLQSPKNQIFEFLRS